MILIKRQPSILLRFCNYICWGLLVFSTVFFSSRLFTDTHILPQWYAFAVVTLIWSAVFFLFRRKIYFKLTPLSIAVTAFAVYLFVRALLSSLITIQILSVPCFLLLFVLFQNTDKKEMEVMNRIVVSLILLQCLYVFLQFAGLVPNQMGFRVTGSFDNPAGLAVCLSAGLPYLFYVKLPKRGEKILRIALIAILWIALILSESRAGILASLTVTAIYIYARYRNRIKYRKTLLTAAGIVILITAASLFFIKKDSSLGRILIWRNTIALSSEFPVFGNGSDSFKANYMLHQAEYFENNPHSEYARLADNVQHPFNEYLLVLTEYGVIGLLFIIAIFVILFGNKAFRDNPYMLSIIAVGIIALFSYPLRYSFVIVMLAYAFGCLSAKEDSIKSVEFNWFGRIAVLFICAISGFLLVRDMSFERQWKKAVDLISLVKLDQAMVVYEELYSKWNHDPLFLYNYGSLLNHAENYRASNKIMSECELYFNDYDVQMIIADNHFNLSKLEDAEAGYILASKMCPNRFMPLYKLFSIYRESNESEKAGRMAEIIIGKPVKVPSATVDHIKTEAEEWINDNKSFPTILP